MVGLILNAPVREGSRRLSDPLLLYSSETAFRVFESSDGALTIEAVDGPIIRRHCCLGMFGCPIKSKCVVLDAFNEANERFVEVLQGITLDDIVHGMTKLKAPFLAVKESKQ